MGAAQSHGGDGAPPPGQQSGNQLQSRRTMGSRPTHRQGPGVVAPLNYEPSSPLMGIQPALQRVESNDPIQQSGVVKNVVSLHKQTLRLVAIPSGNDANVSKYNYALQFKFDAQVDGFISVFYCAHQVIHRTNNSSPLNASIFDLSYVSKGKQVSAKFPFSAGDAQTYEQYPDKALDISQFSQADLQTIQRDRYPIVIRIDASYPSNSSVPLQERVVCQTTFAILEKKRHPSRRTTNTATIAKDSYHPKVVVQQVLINGTIYKLLDLYGIGGGRNATSTNSGDNRDNVDATDECVVCLTEPCTNAVQPCNHLCLCDDCAATLGAMQDRNVRKCPVCRSEIIRFQSFVPPAETLSQQLSSVHISPNSQTKQIKPSLPVQAYSTPRPEMPSTSDAHSSNRSTTSIGR